jgi:malonyl CoA-acyl carrier protein transacylase
VEVLRARGGGEIIESADVTCGLSLGEYTALAFSGAFRCLSFFTMLCLSFCLSFCAYYDFKIQL